MSDDFYNEPKLIPGGIVIDDRGEVMFCNDFQFAGIKRFYLVRNHRAGLVRAWHGHKVEHKFIMCLLGAAKVGAIPLGQPPSSLPTTWTLSAKKPAVLHIPAGWANGWMSLTDNTLMAFCSTSTLDESLSDDFRYAARYWDCWDIEER